MRDLRRMNFRGDVRRFRIFLILVLLVILALTLLFPHVRSSAAQTTGGRPAKLTILTVTPGEDPVAFETSQLVAKNWRRLGFEVDVSPLEFTRLIDLVSNQKNYQVAIVRMASRVDRIDPDHFIYNVLDSEGDFNELNYKNPRYDRLAQLQRTKIRLAERRVYVHQAQAVAAEDAPILPIVHRDILQAYRKDRVTNVKATIAEGLSSFWNFVNVTPQGGQAQVRFGEPVEIGTLNPTAAVAGQDVELVRLIYDSLMRLDEEGKPKTWMAETVRPVGVTGQTYEVTLRPNLRFHDGRPLTSEDVAFTYRYFKQWPGSRFFSWARVVDRVEVLDARRVRFHLAFPYAAFEANSLSLVPILPKHIWEGLLDRERLSRPQDFRNMPPIGSGPFRFVAWRPNQELRLEAFADHFQPPRIRELIRVPYADISGMVRGLQAGEIDFLTWPLPSDALRILRRDQRIAVTSSPEVGGLMLELNCARKPLDNVAVRQALNYAVPRAQVLRFLLEGHGQIGVSMIAPGNTFWHNAKVRRYDFSLEKAREILTGAGFRWDSEGKLVIP